MKVTRRDAKPGETFLGGSGVVIFRGSKASSSKTTSPDSSSLNVCGLFMVSELGALPEANFEKPRTHREAYDLSSSSNITSDDIEYYQDLRWNIFSLYRDHLLNQAYTDGIKLNEDNLDDMTEDGWVQWFETATGVDRLAIEATIEEWLDNEPDWCNEQEYLCMTGISQGAAYNYFLSQHVEVMNALSIAIIEGDCPGSSYYAAEMNIKVDEANRIAVERGWSIRFANECAV